MSVDMFKFYTGLVNCIKLKLPYSGLVARRERAATYARARHDTKSKLLPLDSRAGARGRRARWVLYNGPLLPAQ